MITGKTILAAMGFFFGFIILCAAIGTLIGILEDRFGGKHDD